MDLQKLGKAIHERRKQLNLSQEQLAELSKVAPSTVSNLENGKHAASLDILFSVLDAMDLEPIAFLTPSGK
jgi:transcriptional regulator with XRE-family HTH domain